MKLGACHVETPFIELGQLSTVLYFGYFVLIVPVISLIENTLVDLSSLESTNKIHSLNTRKTSLGKLIFIRNFSTTSYLLYPEDNNSNLTEEQKKKVLDTIKEHEVTNPKPVFQHPGYPDFEVLSSQCRDRGEYDDATDRFKNKPSISPDLARHHEETRDAVVDRLRTQNPEISSYEVRKLILSEQEKDYNSDDDPDIGGYEKSEGDFRAKVNQRAFEHGRDLED